MQINFVCKDIEKRLYVTRHWRSKIRIFYICQLFDELKRMVECFIVIDKTLGLIERLVAGARHLYFIKIKSARLLVS